MKRRDLYQRIETAVDKAIPDVFSKIDLQSIPLPERPESIRTKPSWQQALRYSVSFLVLVGVLFLGFQLAFMFPQTQTHPLETETDILGFQALSAIALVDSDALEELSYQPLLFAFDSTTDFTEAELDTINDYLNMLEMALGNQESAFELIDSDRTEYPVCLRIRRTDLLKQTHEIKVYYQQETADAEIIYQGVVTEMEAEYAFSASSQDLTTHQPSFFRLQIDPLNTVTITDNSDETGQKFIFQTLRSGSESATVEIALTATKNQLRASMKLNILNKQIALKVEKNQENNGFNVEYETEKNSEMHKGNMDIQVTYDEVANRYQYHYTIRNRQGNTQPDYHGNRKKGRQTTTTESIPTTTESDSSSVTSPPSTREPSSPGPGTSQTSQTEHSGQASGSGFGFVIQPRARCAFPLSDQ